MSYDNNCSSNKIWTKSCSAYIELLQQWQRQVQCSVRIARSRTGDRSKSSPPWRPATTFIQPVIEFITTLTCTFINHLSLNYFLWPGSVSVFASVHVTCTALLYGLDFFDELLRSEMAFWNHCDIEFRFKQEWRHEKRFGAINKSLSLRQIHFNSDNNSQEGLSLNGKKLTFLVKYRSTNLYITKWIVF